MDFVGEGGHDISQKSCSLLLSGAGVELDVGEFRDPVDRQEHDQLAVGVSQFAAVDVDIADLVALEPVALVAGLFLRQPGDPMPLEATVQGAPAEIGNGIPQAAQHVVQRQQRLLAERHHDGFLGWRQHRALRSLRPHRRIGRRGPLAPLPHSLGVQVVARCKGAGALFRRLELGSNTRRRAGAAMQNACHRTSSS